MSHPVVWLEDVSVIVDGRTVLSEITWQVSKGESWAVVGPNGAGKTTLLSVINGYRWPSSGKVSVLGSKFGAVDLREMRRRIGMASSYLDEWVRGNDLVRDVVISGKYGSTRLWKSPSRLDERHCDRLLEMLGCGDYKDGRIREVSQGEKQRIMIARALMSGPKLLTLDEPCEGLDLPARESFLATLSALAKRGDPTIVDVTHRTDEIPEGFTHALLLRDGRQVASGPIGRVITGEKLSRCFGLKVRVTKFGERYYTVV